MSSSLAQEDMIKNKILQLLALLTPIQPLILISFLNNICILLSHTSFSTFLKMLALLLADLATHQSISAPLPLTSMAAKCAVISPQVESLTTIPCLLTAQ